MSRQGFADEPICREARLIPQPSPGRRESRPDFNRTDFPKDIGHQQENQVASADLVKIRVAVQPGRPCGGVRKKRNLIMAAERTQNLQDTFLNFVRKNKVPLTIFLVNGVKLQGVVTWFDNFCVLLRRDGHSQLVYKHAISTIMPGHPIQMFEPGDEGQAGA
jgi:host factor-I protein